MSTTAVSLDADLRVVPEMEFCDRLARSMRLVRIKTGDVANYLDIDPATVSRWLSGRNRPNRATLIVLADMTGVELEWLDTGQRACRDSNPKPSVLELVRSEGLRSVKAGLTANRPLLGQPTRHLRSVS